MIGIFDSGFGGLTMVREWLKISPEYDVLFLGDSARTPYGNRSITTITEFTEQGVLSLFAQGAKVVLIACNTASSDALRYLQSKYPEKKILGVLVPAVEEALEKTRFGRIGIIGTRGTIASNNYTQEIQKRISKFYNPSEKRAVKEPVITSVSAPLLVPLIEEGWIKKPETRMILKKYLFPLKHAHIDTLILACTHYPFLEQEFQKKMGKQCTIINSGAAQARKFRDYLQQHPEIEKNLSKKGLRQFYTTDSPDRFRELGSVFLGKKIGKHSIEKLEIE